MKPVAKRIKEVKLDFLYKIGDPNTFLLIATQTQATTYIRSIIKIQLDTMALYDRQ